MIFPPESEPAVAWRLHPRWAPRAALLWLLLAGVAFYTGPSVGSHWKTWSSWLGALPPLHRATPAAWLRFLGGAGWLLLFHACAAGPGLVLLRSLRLSCEDRLERLLLGSALGWGLLGMSMLGWGLMRLWRPWTLGVTLSAGAACLLLAWRQDRRRDARPAAEPTAAVPWTAWEAFLAAVLAAFAAFGFFGASMPEIFYDALVYHLALPDLYWIRGGIVPTPENLFSGLPFLVQMCYGAALPVGGDHLCRLLHCSFGWAAALAVFALGRRFGGRSSGLLAAAFYLSIPLQGAMSWKTAVENGQAMFQTAALLACARLLSARGPARRWAAAAGLLTGFAMGSKYQAWPALPVLTLALWRLRRGHAQGRRDAAVFAAAAVLAVAPWCAKDLAHYGNPLYPLFAGEAGPRWREFLLDAQSVDPRAVLTSREGLASWFTHPWRITLESANHGAMLLLALPAVLLGRFRDAGARLCWLAWLGLWASWSLTSSMVRFLLPHLPAACVLTALMVEEGLARRPRAAVRAGLGYALLFNFAYLTLWFRLLGATDVALGREREADYLRAPHFSYHHPPYAAIEFANAALPADAKILFLGEGRRYFCRRDTLASTYYDPYPFHAWLAAGATVEDLAREFKSAGVTHVLVNRLELGRWQATDRKHLRLTPGQKSLWQEYMARHGRLLFEHRLPGRDGRPLSETAVYELMPAPSKPSAGGG
ncbi:MAG: glycosyltransferase family 39 protein [Elusimicrobia bacterium]|nr:glycosyltransferase family 39 protein [Elusimicrobiota bacterium]